MDLKAYYKKIRVVESTITPPFVVLVGLETPEGGKAGTPTEASRIVAATLIAEGRARLATTDEAENFYQSHALAREEAEARLAAQRMQVTLVGHTELKGSSSKRSRE